MFGRFRHKRSARFTGGLAVGLLVLCALFTAGARAQSAPPPKSSGSINIHQVQVAFIGSGAVGGASPKSSSQRTRRWRRQSRANPSLNPNSLLAGKMQGIPSIVGSTARQAERKRVPSQWLPGQFPTQPSREFFAPLQGINSGPSRKIFGPIRKCRRLRFPLAIL